MDLINKDRDINKLYIIISSSTTIFVFTLIELRDFLSKDRYTLSSENSVNISFIKNKEYLEFNKGFLQDDIYYIMKINENKFIFAKYKFEHRYLPFGIKSYYNDDLLKSLDILLSNFDKINNFYNKCIDSEISCLIRNLHQQTRLDLITIFIICKVNEFRTINNL